MTFEEYLTGADAHFRYVRNTSIPDYRKGQAFMNYLADEEGAARPDLYNMVMYHGTDPFYDDDLLPEFLADVKENW